LKTHARLVPAAVIALLLGAASSSAQLPDLLKNLPQLPSSGAPSSGAGLGDARIGQGLKEALRVGTENAVNLTGRVDGYFANQAIKILMPERLKSLEQGLRLIGQGDRVDELVLGMNRAAEKAAPGARQIFVDAIGEMSIDDARKVLSGPDTAATDYFKGKTTGKLTTTFQPVVQRAMNEVGLARQYKDLLSQAQAIPFFRAEEYDLDRYVVGKSLDGLFHVVGDEERKIRKDPAARTTDLLREVFSRR
jgi:Protein of unknown function (DUF4197)